MNQLKKRGKFIVLEGLDRSGKTSVSKYIKQYLQNQGLSVHSMNFPDRQTPIGQFINDYLSGKSQTNNQTLHLLFSANRWENYRKIEDTLQSGVNIVCDRYWYSGVAYSMAKGMDYQWCVGPQKGLVEPDMVIYLRGDPNQLKNRANYGQQIFEKIQFQQKVHQSFEKLFDNKQDSNIKVLSIQNKNLEQIFNDVEVLIRPIMIQQ